MKELKLKTTDPIGEDHFEYDRISEYDPEKDRHKQVPSTDGSGLQGNQSSSLADSFAGSQLLEVST